MKKFGILNSSLAKVAADLRHTDLVCIGDLGLPTPPGVQAIDLALTSGSPSFQTVLDIYLENILIEKVYLAKEMEAENPGQLEAILKKLDRTVEVVYLTHENLKVLTAQTKAVVRTGENTPYSNIILQSGVCL